MSMRIKAVALFGVILISLLTGLIGGKTMGYARGYEQGRGSIITYVDTAELHLSDRLDQMVAEKSRSKKLHDQVIQRMKFRQAVLKRGDRK